MKPPIVLTVFGTTSRALKTYRHMDAIFKKRFSEHDIHWAFTSRMVKSRMRKKQVDMPHPRQVLRQLHLQGHPWAVVQSLHLICGHEFHRLVDEARQADIRTSMGLPLLTTPEDFKLVADALQTDGDDPREEGTVWIGHGTDHPAWTVYPAFENHLKKVHGPNAHVGVLEGHPSQAAILRRLLRAGIRRVCLAPLLLVAGVHFEEDMAGDTDSWKASFEAHGLEVRCRNEGLGFNATVVRRFCDHIDAALDVIPPSIQRSNQKQVAV